MPRELRAHRERHGLTFAGSSADPAHTLSARIPTPAQTLASAATQGRCGGEKQQVPVVGVVVGKGCLKRLGSVAGGGGSVAAKRVSFVSEPQVRFMSPPAAVEAMGRGRGRGTLPVVEVVGEESHRPRRARFGGGSSVLAGAAAPVRRSRRIAANLGVGGEQVTVVACNSAKFEEEGHVGETVDRNRKRKSRESSENMVVSAQIGISPRSTRSRGLLSEAPFVWPPVDCAGTEEQMVQTVVRKGRLKHSGADVSSRSSGVAKKVNFKLVEQGGAEVAGFRRRPRVVADGKCDAGEAGSTAPLRWSRRNAVNSGASNEVEKIAGAASRNISAKADEEEEDAGEAVDRKRKASDNVEDIGYVWFLPNIATTNLSQIVAATKSVANKMATKVVANFGKKLSLYHVDHGANKVGQATVVAMDQIDA